MLSHWKGETTYIGRRSDFSTTMLASNGASRNTLRSYLVVDEAQKGDAIFWAVEVKRAFASRALQLVALRVITFGSRTSA